MNKDSMCFNLQSLGKLKILANIGDFALLEKMYDTPEKYIVATNFNIEEQNWDYGAYFTKFEDALNRFNDRVYASHYITSPKELAEARLCNALEVIEGRFEPDNYETNFYDLLTKTLKLNDEQIEIYKDYKQRSDPFYDIEMN